MYSLPFLPASCSEMSYSSQVLQCSWRRLFDYLALSSLQLAGLWLYKQFENVLKWPKPRWQFQLLWLTSFVICHQTAASRIKSALNDLWIFPVEGKSQASQLPFLPQSTDAVALDATGQRRVSKHDLQGRGPGSFTSTLCGNSISYKDTSQRKEHKAVTSFVKSPDPTTLSTHKNNRHTDS